MALSTGPIISQADIPIEFSLSVKEVPLGKDLPLKESMETCERNLILRALERCQWHRARTAETLGISLSALKYKMSKLNIYQILDEKRKNGPDLKSEME